MYAHPDHTAKTHLRRCTPHHRGQRLLEQLLWSCLLLLVCTGSPLRAQEPASPSFQVQGDGRWIEVEPYAPNVLRITLSNSQAAATAAPGYGIIAKPSLTGWSRGTDAAGDTVFRSSELQVRIVLNQRTERLPLDKVNNELRDEYFGGGGGGHSMFHSDAIAVTSADGKPLLTMRNWSMYPLHSEPDASSAHDPDAAAYRVSATFDAPTGEHYYGLGQQQKGFLDLRDHRINCWHDYGAVGGENVCVPFLVSTGGYGLVWDNPSKTTVDLGFNQKNVWSSAIGDRISFFVIAAPKTDGLYEGYRLLTGTTHLLPKDVYGYIQSKAIYATQDQVLDVAKGYRERNLPLGTIVVDFLNMTRQGELDLDPTRWPNPAAMNQQLHAMGDHSLLSVWPHFSPGTQFYDMLREKHWLIEDADGKPDFGGFSHKIGPNIDTTNPDAARWWWDSIRDRYIKPDGFDYIWLDETEPDIDPEHDRYFIGSGARFYNVYPLFHTASVYEGFRRDFGDSRRVMILARAAYLGAQRNGTVFWSSDIMSTWDMLKRSIPAGLNFTASGMPYWDTDIAGFFSPSLPANYHAEHKPLIDGSDAKSNIGIYEDYPELYVRWFEWGIFQPVTRSHGEREHNEVWAYGKQAETILSKYLRMRYQLLPYIYSCAYQTYQTGAPFTRALFMDFPKDPNISNITDEYMFGPAILVAPVTDQGATSRKVYLPAGTDWYDYWTNKRYKGGQTVVAAAPIETIPLFVRAGSILPLGSAILTTDQPQLIQTVKVYPGRDADFALYSDDGKTYRYEKGQHSITRLHWNDATRRLTHEGASPWTQPDAAIVKVMQPE